MKIYLGGPMFEQADIEYNLSLAEKLRAEGLEVYCPNENMDINDKSRSDITPERIYDADIAEMLTCNVFLCRISSDPGVMWEGGYMDYLSKVHPEYYYGCIGLTTDIRWKTMPTPQASGIDNQSYYFNGFVIGALKESLGVYYDDNTLITALKKLSKKKEKEA